MNRIILHYCTDTADGGEEARGFSGYNNRMDHSIFQSPFSWRYGSKAMRRIWSEEQKRKLWRAIWVALAQIQADAGLITHEQAEDLEKHKNQVDIARALEIEEEIQHDLMAEVHTFAEQAHIGGGIIHFGATSMDVEDNAEAMRLKMALEQISVALRNALVLLAEQTLRYADTPIIALTHIQPAEPSTLGYRLAQTLQDLLTDQQAITFALSNIKGKGFKGAVGTGASYAELFGEKGLEAFEHRMSQKLNLTFYPISTQTYPRKQDLDVMNVLAGLAQTIYKFAFDLRVLQTPAIGELSEPFGLKQIGSSAMPFKRNPIRAEKIDSLARFLAQMPRIAWDNAAHSLLERTLDDSANRRIMLPEAFLAADEILKVFTSILKGLQVNKETIQRNLDRYGPFAATEKVLMACVKRGADRQRMHEILRVRSMTAWQAIQLGKPNPLADDLARDEEIKRFIPVDELLALMNHQNHIGFAGRKARSLAEQTLLALNF